MSSANAEQLSFAASVINLGGSDTTGVGYDTNAKYLIPDFGRRDQSLQFELRAIKQSLQAYDLTAHTTGVTLTRKLSSSWTASVGGTTADEQVTQEWRAALLHSVRSAAERGLRLNQACFAARGTRAAEFRALVSVTPHSGDRPPQLPIHHHPGEGLRLL